jgi:hypothetical protein
MSIACVGICRFNSLSMQASVQYSQASLELVLGHVCCKLFASLAGPLLARHGRARHAEYSIKKGFLAAAVRVQPQTIS